jgi:hypothetical protein
VVADGGMEEPWFLALKIRPILSAANNPVTPFPGKGVRGIAVNFPQGK